jgi:ferredoxin
METLTPERSDPTEQTSSCCGGDSAPAQETTSCCGGSAPVEEASSCCGGSATLITDEFITHPDNTLAYSAALCINCEMCLIVCPHAVFAPGEHAVVLANPQDCMECGACQVNCPVDAIIVDSGVGCAAAMIQAALLGREEVICGSDDPGATCC